MSGRATFRIAMRTGEAGTAAVVLVLGLAILITSLRMPGGSAGEPGPAMFPIGLGAGILATGAGLLLRALRMTGNDTNETVEIGSRDVWLGLVSLGALAFVFEPLGFPIAASLFAWALLWAWSPLGRIKSLLAAIAAVAIAWFVFARLLGVNLPLGVLRGLIHGD